MIFSKRVSLFFLLVCLGCSAQLAPDALSQRIERQLRVTYNVPADVKVLISTPRSSDFPNYDALTVTFDGGNKKQNYEFLISKDQKTLIRMTKMDLTRDPYAEIMNKIDLKERPIRGNRNAKVTVVSYDDFECPYCSQMHRTLFPELLKEYGDRVAFVYKDYPLAQIHPWATHAAVDANCLGMQNPDAYWDFADYIHANQPEVNEAKGRDAQFAELDKITSSEGDKFKVDSAKLQACLKDQKDDVVKASTKEGEALGVDGTPTLFVNGQRVDGVKSIADLRTTLDSMLQQAGVPPPVHVAASAAAAPPQPATPAATAAAPATQGASKH